MEIDPIGIQSVCKSYGNRRGALCVCVCVCVCVASSSGRPTHVVQRLMSYDRRTPRNINSRRGPTLTARTGRDTLVVSFDPESETGDSERE